MEPIRREMQMVFQDPFASLNPRKRVGQIIGMPLGCTAPGATEVERTGPRAARQGRAVSPSTSTATPMSSPAASASASAWLAHWRSSRG